MKFVFYSDGKIIVVDGVRRNGNLIYIEVMLWLLRFGFCYFFVIWIKFIELSLFCFVFLFFCVLVVGDFWVDIDSFI